MTEPEKAPVSAPVPTPASANNDKPQGVTVNPESAPNAAAGNPAGATSGGPQEGVPAPQPGPIQGVPNVGTGVPFQSASLYVGDLHPDVTEALLYDIFNAVGPVASIRVCRDAVTRRSLGYAYVNFHNTQDAERALETMNYTQIKDRPCRMMWSQRDPSLRKNGAGNVFVKHLDLSIDNKALFDTFSLFGNILSCKVVTDSKGKSRGYGFVHFETTEAADEAIKKINGMLLAGKEVYVGKFLKKNERPSMKEWTNVYVKNLPYSWNRDKLQQVFEECGPISSAIVMEDEGGRSKGFGFVDFVEHEGAVKAIEQFNGFEPERPQEASPPPQKSQESTEADKENDVKKTNAEDGVEQTPETEATSGKENEKDEAEKGPELEKTETSASEVRPRISPTALVVCRAQKKSERERELAQKFEELKIERQSKYQGVNLYVKNLDDRIDDDSLRKEFEPFGTITSARVMRERGEGKNHGASKGFGFVCFSAPEEAIRAVTEMNGKLVMGKPIYVALAQRKEQRRAQLEAQHRQQQRMMNVAGLGPQPGMFPYNAGMNNMGGMNNLGNVGNMNNLGGMGGMGSMNMGMNNPGQGQQFSRFNPQTQAQMQQMMGMMRGQNPNNSGPNAGPGMNSGPQGGPRGVPQPFQGPLGRGNMQNMQFNANARNTGMGMQQQLGAMAQNQQMRGSLSGNLPQGMNLGADAPLSAEALASANQQQRKTMIGEKLYPMVLKLQPQFAAKITGMLLEMDNNELLHLLESPDALVNKVNEAMEVLKKAAR